MNTYLLELGRNLTLSRAELAGKCDEVLVDEKHHLALVENVNFENPRGLPKSEEQIFLDRIGGAMRIAKIVGEFGSKSEMVDRIAALSATDIPGEKPKIGVNSWGTGGSFLPMFLKSIKEKMGEVRIENAGGQNLSSGQAFDRKLLKRGHEFLVWQRGDSFLLAETAAIQNLRNYVLRDRSKPFRDAKMGMLPPKLAQMLINFAAPEKNDRVVDPFCGSGTVCSEAAIAGWRTAGSDLNAAFVDGARENFKFLGEKFRYEREVGTFRSADACQLPWSKLTPCVVATEGWLGENFSELPTPQQADQQAREVLKMWDKFWENCRADGPRQIALCLPQWHTPSGNVSILEKMLASAEGCGYTPLALFDGEVSCVYERPDAFVAREIVIFKKK